MSNQTTEPVSGVIEASTARAGAPRMLSFDIDTLSALGVAVLVADADNCIVSLNSAAERLTGFSDEAARGKLLDVVFQLSYELDAHAPASFRSQTPAKSTSEESLQAYVNGRDGRRRAVTFVVDRTPGTAGLKTVVLAHDVTEDRLNVMRLLHVSTRDPLTGLLNRSRFIRQLDRALPVPHAKPPHGALILLDVDRFRLVNDAAGLEAGDSLLAWLAALLREAIDRDDVCGRLGGNEFGILLRAASPERALMVAHDVQQRLKDFRFTWQGSTFGVRSSIGIVNITPEFGSATVLLRTAETATATAKEQGGNRLFVQPNGRDPDLTGKQQAISWVTSIKSNLRNERARLFFQPIVALSPNRAQEKPSAEILFRMLDAGGVARGPQDVVRMAERYNLMDEVDEWVIHRAFKTLGASPKLLDAVDHYAINLSATSLAQDSLLETILREIDQSRVPPSKICFEITETAAVENLGEARWLMQELGSLGCRFALDDFGSGMASYSYLRDLGVDYIKIDRSFIHDIDVSNLSAAIVESIHQIAVLLGAKTIAEGVETEAVAEKLTALGIDYAQGYLFARPQPLEHIG